MTKKVALLTGGTGFIGSNLAKHLTDNNWEVHLLIRRNSSIPPQMQKRVICHSLDGSIDSLEAIIGEASPSVIFHLASFFRAEHNSTDISEMVESNILFGVQLLEAATKLGFFNIVTAGTSWQNADDGAFNPACLYAATKQAFNDLATYYVKVKGLKLITLKLFDTYGPMDLRKKLFYAINSAADSKLPLHMSPGMQLIDIVYIDDVVTAFELAALRLIDGSCILSEEYVVSSGSLITLKELVGYILRISGLKVEILWGGRNYRDNEVMNPWRGGANVPGWVPKIALQEGINMVYKDRLPNA